MRACVPYAIRPRRPSVCLDIDRPTDRQTDRLTMMTMMQHAAMPPSLSRVLASYEIHSRPIPFDPIISCPVPIRRYARNREIKRETGKERREEQSGKERTIRTQENSSAGVIRCCVSETWVKKVREEKRERGREKERERAKMRKREREKRELKHKLQSE
ncbi:hypothetical protein BKA80DRAFT_34139 [Phyllosticta citrichinensis]